MCSVGGSFFAYSWRVSAFCNIQINIHVHLETHDAFRIVSIAPIHMQPLQVVYAEAKKPASWRLMAKGLTTKKWTVNSRSSNYLQHRHIVWDGDVMNQLFFWHLYLWCAHLGEVLSFDVLVSGTSRRWQGFLSYFFEPHAWCWSPLPVVLWSSIHCFYSQIRLKLLSD